MKILHIITSLLDGGAEGVLFRICSHDKNNQHIVISLGGMTNMASYYQKRYKNLYFKNETK